MLHRRTTHSWVVSADCTPFSPSSFSLQYVTPSYHSIHVHTKMPHQWGWPSADGSISYYYDGQYELLVNQRYVSVPACCSGLPALTYMARRHFIGDKNTFLVNTTGWVTWDDVFPE